MQSSSRHGQSSLVVGSNDVVWPPFMSPHLTGIHGSGNQNCLPLWAMIFGTDNPIWIKTVPSRFVPPRGVNTSDYEQTFAEAESNFEESGAPSDSVVDFHLHKACERHIL